MGEDLGKLGDGKNSGKNVLCEILQEKKIERLINLLKVSVINRAETFKKK